MSFLVDPSSDTFTPFNVSLVRLHIRLIHYVFTHILVPKKHNFVQLFIMDVILV